ncbi:unnamed protein product [Cladocopium goreaui]|uniref:Protein spalten n=1 Tax=Cladocopium goreaui TaxID=2562237 RepID=A0A9P1CH05_9DINO|nr:unnamed protein product [Cladocopium goreaui]
MAPVAGHAPALMPAQPGQSVQPQVQVRYQSPGPILHPLQPTMVSPRGYVVAPAAPTLPPTPEVMPRHRLVMAPGSPRAQTMSAQNLQTAEPVTSPIANHRLILQSHGSVPLIQSIYSPLRAPEISDPGSQDSLAQQVKALQAARASAPPLNLSLDRGQTSRQSIESWSQLELHHGVNREALPRFTPVSVISSAVIGSTSYGFLLTAQWLGRRAWELFYMLSVLSSSTINLTEELHRTRQDLILSRFEAAGLADALALKRTRLVQHLENFWGLLKRHQDKVRLSRAFQALSLARQHVWRRPPKEANGGNTGSVGTEVPRAVSSAAWRWLWKKKVFGHWRRGAHLALRERHREEHHHQLTRSQNSVLELQGNLERLHDRRVDTDALLVSERARCRSLEKELALCQEQVKDLQRTLKEAFVQQFDAQQRQEELESHFSKLASDFRELKAQKEQFESDLAKARSDLQEAHHAQAEKEQRLMEASSELSLAEEVIEDITTSKLVGLRRFFEHYDLPAVSLSLFCKVVELQHHLRTSWKVKGERLSAPGAIEKEVQEFSTQHQVSRRGLQAYLEGLNLTVSASMVSQVILALLGLDSPSDCQRFASLLLQPPHWQQGDFATALWGAAAEPAASLLAKHRSARGK